MEKETFSTSKYILSFVLKRSNKRNILYLQTEEITYIFLSSQYGRRELQQEEEEEKNCFTYHYEYNIESEK